MPTIFPPSLLLMDKRAPVVLPRGCSDFVEFEVSGWPRVLVIPSDAGLLDPSCAYWHGTTAANDSSDPASVAP